MIVLKSSRENIGQYEKAEAVVLFLCKECADHIRMLGLPEDFYEAVAYQIKTQGYGFTDKGSITSALMKTGSGSEMQHGNCRNVKSNRLSLPLRC